MKCDGCSYGKTTPSLQTYQKKKKKKKVEMEEAFFVVGFLERERKEKLFFFQNF